MTYVLTKNTPEIREELKHLGFDICICTEFEGAAWLSYIHNRIHGMGFTGEEFSEKTTNDMLVYELSDCTAMLTDDLNTFISWIK